MSDLIDRQAFIENERKLYCEDCDRRKGTKNGKPNVVCYEIGEAPCRACWLDDALTDLEDFPTFSPWHRVEEELPNEFDTVIVYGRMKYDHEKDYEVFVDAAEYGRYSHDRWVTWNDWHEGQEEFKITHWMPLPEPPKEDEHGK